MEDHRRILRDERVYLVEHLDLVQTVVFDHLVQEGVLRSEKLAAMRERYNTNMGLASALVSHLETRSNEDWKIFLQCLRIHGQEHIAEHMERLPDTPDAGGSRGNTQAIQREVAMAILRDFNHLELWDWMDDTVSVKLDDLYTELVYANSKQTTEGPEEKQLLLYTDMFSERDSDRQPVRVYIEGVAGTGKTTLVKRLVVDWARYVRAGWWRRRFRTPIHVKRRLGRYDLVLPVFLRDITEGQNLAEAVLENLKIQTEGLTMENILRGNQERILVIFDGLDEYRDDKSCHISKVLKREEMVKLDIIITSRNHPSLHFKTVRQMPSTHVVLKGFSNRSVNTYIESFFHGKPECDRLSNEISKSEERKELSRYPAILLLMCVVWRDQHTIADTLTDFYTDFLKYVCGRFERKFVDLDNRSDPQDILHKYHPYIIEIGHIAVNGLMGDTLELTFNVSVLRALTDTAKQLGLLNTRKKVSFQHKTLQEYLAAYYIINCDPYRRQELFLHLVNSSSALKEATMIVTFLEGLGKDIITNIIRNIIEGSQGDKVKTLTAVQLSYLSETSGESVLPKIIELEFSQLYTPEVLNHYFSMNSSEVEEITIWTPSIRQLRYLGTLQSANIKKVTVCQSDTGFVDGSVIGLDTQRRPGPPIEIDTLVINGIDRFSMEDIVWLGGIIAKNTGVTFSNDLVHITINDKKSEKNIHQDFLVNQILVPSFSTDVLSIWPFITHVSVKHAERNLYREVLHALSDVSQIKELSLCGCSYASDIVPIVERNNMLERITIPDSIYNLEACLGLGRALNKLTELKELRITRMTNTGATTTYSGTNPPLGTRSANEESKNMQGDLMILPHIMLNLANFTQLEIIDLTGYAMGMDLCQSLGDRLSMFKEMQEIRLGTCDCPDATAYICQGLNHASCLEILDMSKVSFNSEAFEQLARHGLPSIQILRLGTCVDFNAIRLLFESIQHSSRELIVLDVSRVLVSVNEQREIAQIMEKCPRLKELRVCKCDVIDGVRFVIESLKHTPAIEILDLSGNISSPEVHEILDVRGTDSGNTVTSDIYQTLSERIKVLPKLRELRLCKCHDPRGLILVINCLKYLTDLQVLCLLGNFADFEVYSELEKQLPHVNNLKVLRLCACKDTNAVRYVINVSHLLHKLQVLDLSGVKAKRSKRQIFSELWVTSNCVTVDVYQQLGDQLEHLTELRELRLPCCDKVDAIRPVVRGLRHTPRLHTLDLLGNEVSFDVLTELGQCLIKMKGLKELRLCYSEHHNAVRAVVQNLHETTGLVVLDLSGNKNIGIDNAVPVIVWNTGDVNVFEPLCSQLMFLPGLRELRFCGCRIDRRGEAEAVLNSLQYTPRLQVLKIEAWSLDAEGLKQLSERLGGLRDMRQLLLGDCDVYYKGDLCKNELLNDMQMHSAWTKCIVRFPEMPALQVINISYNNIGNDSVVKLSHQLQSLSHLDTLYISSCGLTDAQAVLQLIDALPSCPTLRVLNISNNYLGDGLSMIVKMTRQLSGLYRLNLENNYIFKPVPSNINDSLREMLPDLFVTV